VVAFSRFLLIFVFMMDSIPKSPVSRPSRRSFIAQAGGAALAGVAASGLTSAQAPPPGPGFLTFGAIADLHYAEKDMAIGRYYSQSADKFREAIGIFSERKAAFVVGLGDLIDKAEKEAETAFLAVMENIFLGFGGGRFHVLGNHDVATFSKEEFIALAGEREYPYSVTIHGWHFVVLDANFRRDGSPYNAGNFDWTETYIPPQQVNWLMNDLAQNIDQPAVIFVHQNLHDEADPHGVKNAPEVRMVLEDAGNVRAVFQGHNHKGGFARIKGIPYVTLMAAVDGSGPENNAYALVALREDETIAVQGFGKQPSYNLK
jgi:predicted phosphodiesterase